MLQARPVRGDIVRSRVRAGLVAAASLLVVIAAVAYVFAPSTATLTVGFREIAGEPPAYETELTPSYYLAAARTAVRTTAREVVYGKVASRGVPVKNVALTLQGIGSPRQRQQKATIRPKGLGTYRAVLRLAPGNYRITVTLTAGRKKRVARMTHALRNHRSYDVSILVRSSGVITLLPTSSY